MKKTLIFAVVFASLSGAGAFAADPVEVDGLYFSLSANGTTATLARNDAYKAMTAISVPGQITVGGTVYAVDSIAQQAFQDCAAMESLNLGEGIHGIGKWALWHCTALKEVSFPSTLRVVDNSAFSGCTAVTSLELPDDMSVFGDVCFGNMTSLTELTLPANLKTLGNSAFSGCSNLKTVHFGNKLEAIEKSAFYQCGFETLVFPETLTSIGTGAFSGNNKLTSVTLPSGMKSIGSQAFYKCGTLKQISLPEGFTSLGDAAFYECTSLETLPLPSTIGFIDANCFYGCSSLKSIEIPSTIRDLSKNMFYNCTSLESVKLPAEMTSIGSSAFFCCSSLKNIELPKGITVISADMFNRAGITSITIPEGVTSIENNAFRFSSLTSLHIPASVSSIAGSCVLSCGSLTEITVDEANSVFASLEGALVSKDLKRLIDYPAGLEGVYDMPDCIEVIEDMVFQSNYKITGINFSKNLRSIGASNFYDTTGITEYDLPDGLQSIGSTCFFMNRAVESILLPNNDLSIGNNALSATSITHQVFPEGITSIGVNADGTYSVMGMCSTLKWISLPSTLTKLSPIASGCSALEKIYCFATVPPVLSGSNAVAIEVPVAVPEGTAEAYKAAWGELYPSVTFEEILPAEGVIVTTADGSATLAWDAYADDIYTGTPVAYDLELTQDAETMKNESFDGEPGEMTRTISGLSEEVYDFTLKGYDVEGRLTLLQSGKIDLTKTAITEIATEGASEATECFDLLGRRVSSAAAGIKLQRASDGKVTKVL